MGCCHSSKSIEGHTRNHEIDNQLKRDKFNMRNEVKMLLLGKSKWGGMTRRRLNTNSCIPIGTGESGKSTILKQMKLLHDGGYTQDEREAFKEIIFSNTIQSMQAILEAMQNLDCRLKDENRPFASIILDQSCQVVRDFLPPDVTQAIKRLWKDPNLQSIFERSREYQLNDSAK